MANIKSAKKRNRQNEKRRVHNRTYRNRTRTMVKRAMQAIDGGDVSEAKEATRLAVKDLDMLATKGIIHKKNADRRKSRLMRRLAQMEGA